MKRDLELIRTMILTIEDSPSAWAPDFEISGYTQGQIGYHSYLLIDAGLCAGDLTTSIGSQGPEAIATHLTWKGHEFADAARDEARWKKARKLVAEKAGSATFEVVKDLLTGLLRAALALPG